MRESARIYREFCEGRLSAGELEVRSRHLRRHSEVVTSIEQHALLTDMQQRFVTVEALLKGRQVVAALIPADRPLSDEMPQ